MLARVLNIIVTWMTASGKFGKMELCIGTPRQVRRNRAGVVGHWRGCVVAPSPCIVRASGSIVKGIEDKGFSITLLRQTAVCV